jgi:hypothetical protein
LIIELVAVTDIYLGKSNPRFGRDGSFSPAGPLTIQGRRLAQAPFELFHARDELLLIERQAHASALRVLARQRIGESNGFRIDIFRRGDPKAKFDQSAKVKLATLSRKQ